MATERPFNNPFAALGGKVANLPEGPANPPTASAEPTATGGQAPERLARAVVRYQRKGYGGKEVTRIEQLALDAGELEGWLGDLKRALGCGGRIEDDVLVLQGDQRERVKSWLVERGLKKVTVS